MLFKLILTSVFLFNQITWAAQPIPAVEVQKFISGFSNVNHVLNLMQLRFAKREIEELKAYLVEQGVNLQAPLPKTKIENNKVIIDNQSIVVMSDNAVLLNDAKLIYDSKISLKQNFIKFQKTKKSASLFDLFVPEANAIIIFAYLPTIIGYGILAVASIGWIQVSMGIGSENDQPTIACSNKKQFLIKFGDKSEPLSETALRNIFNSNTVPKCERDSTLKTANTWLKEILAKTPKELEQMGIPPKAKK